MNINLLICMRMRMLMRMLIIINVLICRLIRMFMRMLMYYESLFTRTHTMYPSMDAWSCRSISRIRFKRTLNVFNVRHIHCTIKRTEYMVCTTYNNVRTYIHRHAAYAVHTYKHTHTWVYSVHCRLFYVPTSLGQYSLYIVVKLYPGITYTRMNIYHPCICYSWI